ncbi:M48 family metallopeptidase [Sphingomonas sp.]|uniref:M48 family metallopeptidase n=1 Tax=Sphingomonas sp. TaxID=28214 RepID=UPI001B0AE1ED|nr:M48 family metallopeptidase [Sphingomonas sp.]MBO9711500.1 M48 family metalloprotease [Sphingomonas sp.]
MTAIAFRFTLFLAALAGLLQPAAAADSDEVVQLLLFQAVEARIAGIGYRLATAAGDLCPKPVPLSGIQVQDASLYPPSEDASLAAAFGGGPWPKVFAVVPGSPAAAAGLKANDSIVAIDGRPVPPATRRPDYGRVLAALGMLDAALAGGRAELAVERDGKRLDVAFDAARGCASRFQLKASGAKQALADGRYVEVTSGLAAFATDDDELAAAIAHEMAHNILGHRAALDAAGVQRGILQNFGRNARLTRATELEADRFSVYLLDRAGYPMEGAVRLWQRMGKETFDFGDFTHPGAAKRIAAIEGEIARIRAAKARGEVARFEP